MKTDKLFRYASVFVMIAMIVSACMLIQDKIAFAANQPIVQDDLGGTQAQPPQEQIQPSEANPMQEPEQIEEAQNLGQAPQQDETPQPNEPDEVEQGEAPQ